MPGFLNDEQRSLASEIASLLVDRGEPVAVAEATIGRLDLGGTVALSLHVEFGEDLRLA